MQCRRHTCHAVAGMPAQTAGHLEERHMDPLWLFALLSIGIMVVPGMDMAFVLSSALVDGRRAGFAAVAGMVAGAVVHVTMGALGIGLLLQVAPAAFNTLLAT